MKKNNTKKIIGGIGLLSSFVGAYFNNVKNEKIEYIYEDDDDYFVTLDKEL